MTEDREVDISSRQQRHISVQRFFEISLLLMLGTAFLTLSTTGKLDSVSIVLFSLALGAKLWSYARGESGLRLQTRTVNRIAIGYLFFFLLDFAVIERGPSPADRMLPATVHLILFVTVMKIISARRYRDYAYLAALSFLMMLAAAVLTAGPGYLLGLALYVLFSICMFISFDIKSGCDWASDPPRGPFPDPARNRIAVENSLVLTSLSLAMGTAALAAILFFMIPRYRASVLGSLGTQAEGVTGFSNSMSLGEIGKMKRSNLVVMYILPQNVSGKAVRAPGLFRGTYWRGIALSRFDGQSWFNRQVEGLRLPRTGTGNFVLPRVNAPEDSPHHLLRYKVFLTAISADILFAAARPVEVSGPFKTIALDPSGSLHRVGGGGSAVEYSVISDITAPPPSELREDTKPAPPEITRVNLSLPPLDPRIATLARRIAGSQTNDYDRAIAIEDYLRLNFGYTLDPPSIQPHDPVGSFLFVAKKGYCSYFATAMALMLRSLSVPARVVNGFRTGEYNPVGHDFVVRARDAHSWVEVYFPGHGWIPFDPTPPGGNDAATSNALENYLDAASLFWNEWIINYDSRQQAILGLKLARHSHHLRASALHWLRGAVHHGSGWAGRGAGAIKLHKLLLLFLGLAFGAYWFARKHTWLGDFRILHTPRFKRRGETSAFGATRAYRQLQKLLERRGVKCPPSQTPRELAMTLSASPAAKCVSEFIRLYNALRFGNEPVGLDRFAVLLKEITSHPPFAKSSARPAKN
ncbi:MAG: DUF3488 domain-containing protein [Acidobacteriota bacterium]|nr:DUF3488 domain-containing protein [Acidobacteriota bacterium]